ncbi:MAG: malate dehydrogenase [Betaproteobacteria bacterium AqS2]|uniref:Malate dehydrogenase n=1 Tax=Candidatus Amphirhobacter heronislandensis TaxID=1732024 RepID=A0A930UBN3_9GAMM|nr:malate dehydrogenase [Betaproteobacteria bacterium AqS2]
MRGAADLSLAYTPGVAAPCLAISRNPEDAYRYTGKGNLVGIISNGTAVLGLGNIGPLAAKPVMEGKAMLFKKCAGIDVFDIELSTERPEHFIEIVLALADTFGAINLEDIAAPDCFQIQDRLAEQLSIPIMHDDQSGTAVVACAAIENALRIQDKKICDVKLVCVGAGAAGIGILKLARAYFGLALEQIHLVDSRGLVTVDRLDLPTHKLPYAKPPVRDASLAEAVRGADVLIGVSGGGIVTPEMVASMAGKPVIMAMANPDPEIMPAAVHAVRPDAIVATGRSDLPNQVNNSVCFPYLFRAALDARATRFTHAMFAAAVAALAGLAEEPAPPELRKMYRKEAMEFGPEYILPKQDDPRLRGHMVPAIEAAWTPADAAA